MPISTLSQFIFEINKINRDSNFLYYFRGHSDTSFKLIPSIYRNKRYSRNEEIIFKEAMLQAPHEFINEKTTLEKLVKIQHYGIPTRLLDITSNPLIALYFACNEFYNRNGNIIVFQVPKNEIKFYDSDTVSILSNLAKRPYNFRIDNLPQADIDLFNAQEEMKFLLHEIHEEKPYFKPIINARDLERVVAVKVRLNNGRIIRQNGAFLIFGINGIKEEPASIPSKWLIHKSSTQADLIVSAANKKDIINELNNLGINRATLFPELQNLGEYLKDIYK